jgi:O-acetyl-ADP-ribose deacetylase
VTRIEIIQGDITRIAADAIVNAANSRLLPGGGVCGAIHAAGGPTITEECSAYVAAHGPVPPGGAAVTGAGRLPATYVIHAVGPIWRGGGEGEAETLASAYRSSLVLAQGLGIDSIAFPAISTGIFGFPSALAAPIAIETVRDWLAAENDAGGKNAATLQLVTFVLFDEHTMRVFWHAFEESGP